MGVFWRYWLLQVPGWGVLVVALIIAHRHFGLSTAWAVTILVLWVLKDWVIYPFLKDSYRFRDEDPSLRLVGKRAVAQQPLEPRGYVRLGGELWIAEIAKGAPRVAPGDEVVVESVEGLTLRVHRAEGGAWD